jgi:hypothetical protein
MQKHEYEVVEVVEEVDSEAHGVHLRWLAARM